MSRPSRDKIERLAYEIKDFMIRHELWMDTRIYFNGKALSTDDGNGHYAYNDPAVDYVLEQVDPRQFFEYTGQNILCMSFEGPFYDVMNVYVPVSYYNIVETEFSGILRKYGLIYELGHPWNLSTFEI